MTFSSILFQGTEDSEKATTIEEPDFFVDLNLDQVIDAITAGKQEYELKPFFYIPLNDIDAISYRHEIMRDLENIGLFELLQSFAKKNERHAPASGSGKEAVLYISEGTMVSGSG